MTEPTAVGIDVGATKAEAVLVTGEGTIHARALADTPATDGPAVLEAMRSVAEQVRDPNAVAIGVGAAGLVELGTGRMRFAPNIAWRDVDLREVLAPLGLPTVVDNDCTVAAVGERRAAPAGAPTISCTSGSGPGSAAGSCSAARSSAEPTGSPARSGTSSWSRAASCVAAATADAGRPSRAVRRYSRLGRERLGLDGHGVVAAAGRGDETAHAILEEVGARIGQGLAGLANVLDPALVIVGGGPTAAAGDLLLDPARRAFGDAIEAAAYRPEVPIVPASLGADSVAVGAALWALRRHRETAGCSCRPSPRSRASRSRWPSAPPPPATRRSSSTTTCSRPADPSARRSSPSRCWRPRPPPTRAWGPGCVSRAGYRPLGILAKETSGLAYLAGGDTVLGLGLGDKFGARRTRGGRAAVPADRGARRAARGDRARDARALRG